MKPKDKPWVSLFSCVLKSMHIVFGLQLSRKPLAYAPATLVPSFFLDSHFFT